MPDQRYEANRKTIGSLLSVNGPSIEVPEWQRSYAWDSAQIEAFWSDLTTFNAQYPDDNISDQEYFLGSIVLVSGGTADLLLDGQQRLATATILLAALRDARRPFKSDAATRLQNKYISEYNDEKDETRYILSLNVYDRQYFRDAVQSDTETGTATKATLKSHGLIQQARDYFAARIREKYESLEGGKASFDWNLRIGRVLTDHMSVVAVSSSDEDNAASVFETLNDRGIGLSTPDLLRNYLLRVAPDAAAREGIVDAWQQVLSIEDEAGVDRFLRHYWVSLHGDVKTRSLYREIKESLRKVSADPLEFSKDLSAAAGTYRDLVTATAENADLRAALDATKELGASVLYPALLAGQAAAGETVDDLRLLAQDLVTLFVRYNIAAGRETTVLETLVYDVAKTLRVNKDFAAATHRLRALAPEDPDFTARFAKMIVSRRKTARYLLTQLEQAQRTTEELAIAGTQRVHVEHIYPQTPAEGGRWPNHTSAVNRLGNQTLLSRRLNTSIKNAGFDKKVSSYVKSEIEMTKGLANVPDWNMEAIEIRQASLADLAREIWDFSDADKELVSASATVVRTASTGAFASADATSTPLQLPEVPTGSGAA